MANTEIEMTEDKPENSVQKKSKHSYELPWIEKHRPR